MEVGDHGVGHFETVRRIDELVGPHVGFAVHFGGFNHAAVIDGRLEGFHCGGAHDGDLVSSFLGLVDFVSHLRADDHALGVGFVFRQIFDVDIVKIA